MRDYGIVSPKFWIGETGKKLRRDPEAQVLALYLMTSPHSSMTGVFHCPHLYMSNDTGLSMEATCMALARLIKAGFCEYDDDTETVFVYRMAAFQIGEELRYCDKRIVGLRREARNMPDKQRAAFLKVYGEPYQLIERRNEAPPESPPQAPPQAPSEDTDDDPRMGLECPSEGALMPLLCQEQEQEQDQSQEQEKPQGKSQEAQSTRKKRTAPHPLPADFPGEAERVACKTTRPDLSFDVVAAKFRRYWTAQKAHKADWPRTWANWIARETGGAGRRMTVEEQNAQASAEFLGNDYAPSTTDDEWRTINA